MPIPRNTQTSSLFVLEGYTAYVRTRYQRYIGDFVLHCHTSITRTRA